MAVCLSLCVSLTAGCTRRPMAAGTDSPRTACDPELEKKKKKHRYIKQLQERRNHYKETLNTSSSTTNKSPQMGKNGVPAWFFFPWKIWRMKSDSRTSAVSNKLHKKCWMCQEMIQIKTSINCKLRLNKYSKKLHLLAIISWLRFYRVKEQLQRYATSMKKHKVCKDRETSNRSQRNVNIYKETHCNCEGTTATRWNTKDLEVQHDFCGTFHGHSRSMPTESTVNCTQESWFCFKGHTNTD